MKIKINLNSASCALVWEKKNVAQFRVFFQMRCLKVVTKFTVVCRSRENSDSDH